MWAQNSGAEETIEWFFNLFEELKSIENRVAWFLA